MYKINSKEILQNYHLELQTVILYCVLRPLRPSKRFVYFVYMTHHTLYISMILFTRSACYLLPVSCPIVRGTNSTVQKWLGITLTTETHAEFSTFQWWSNRFQMQSSCSIFMTTDSYAQLNSSEAPSTGRTITAPISTFHFWRKNLAIWKPAVNLEVCTV